MASAEAYAKWIVDNQDKKGTPEFDTVAKAYQAAKGQTQAEKPAIKTPLEESVDWRDYSPILGSKNPASLKNLLAPPVEAGLAMGSAGLAASKGGYDAIASYLQNKLAGRGMDVPITDPKQMTANAVQRYGYQPRSEGGQAIVEALSGPLQAYGEKATEMGDRAQAATGSKLYGAGTEAVIHALPMAFGARNPKSPYPAKANPVVEAIRNRLPGGTRATAKNVLSESAGPRITGVRDALMDAPKKQTAGQATAPAQSAETSALWKMSETEKPSEFRNIYKQQEAERIAKLQREAGTPEAQQAQKNVRKDVADALYDRGRTGVLNESDVSSVLTKVDSLIENNPGFPELQTSLRGIRKGLVDDTGVIRTDAQQVMSTVEGLKKLISTKDAGNLKGPLISLKKDVVRLSDDFVEADRFYAKASRDITQGEIFQELVDTLKPKLGSIEKATQYVNAITGRGQKLTTKRATGKTKPPRTEFESQLEPRQIEIVKAVENDLQNNALYSELASTGATKMNKIAGTAWTAEKLRILDTKMVILNNIWKRIEGRTKQSTLDFLSDLNKPENRADLIKIYNEALPEELAILRQSTIGVGTVAPAVIAGAQEAGEQ